MSTIRITSPVALIGLAALLAGACSKTDQGTPADSPAAATAITPDSTSMTPRALEIGDIDMGRHVGADRKISDKTDDFAPADTIYAAVDTKNAGSGKLTARWTFEDGKLVQEDSQTITPVGDTTVTFHVAKAGGLPAGKYTLHVLLNDAEVKSKDVTVKKP